MDKRDQKSSVVLKYGKRRYDGGNEIELIKAIERQKATQQLNDLQKEHLVEIQQDIAQKQQVGHDNPIVKEPVQAKALAPEPASPTKKKRALDALILGPLELCIGSVGMLTASLAILTFKQANNQVLVDQSKAVLKDCCMTFRKGLVDCATTPYRVLKPFIHQK